MTLVFSVRLTCETVCRWQEYLKMLICLVMAVCIVSFVDLDGVRHSVEVQADGLYEAAVLAFVSFKKHDFRPSPNTLIDVEVKSSITHTLAWHKVGEWLERSVRTPKEAILKERLRAML